MEQWSAEVSEDGAEWSGVCQTYLFARSLASDGGGTLAEVNFVLLRHGAGRRLGVDRELVKDAHFAVMQKDFCVEWKEESGCWKGSSDGWLD